MNNSSWNSNLIIKISVEPYQSEKLRNRQDKSQSTKLCEAGQD